MVETRKHSINYAAALSGLNKSQFSKYLANNKNVAAITLDSLSKKQGKKLGKIKQKVEGLPWSIFIIIDSTIQNRSSERSDNVQKFNHGKGYVIGHQWTNIVLYINDVLVPLEPIPFYSKNYCKKNGIEYKTEHERLNNYLKKLNLKDFIGPHASRDVVVLADSGYDAIEIQNTILEKKWHFVVALKKPRCVKSEAKFARTPKKSGWEGVEDFFKNQRRLPWETIRIEVAGPNKKRLDCRVRRASAFLKQVGKVQVACSEYKKKRSDGRRKYLACSDLKAQPRQIIMAYRLRWKIEIFHKHIKMHLGFEDVATKHFCSVETHVRLVYCAYILLNLDPPGVDKNAKTILDKQRCVKLLLDNREVAENIQIATQIGGIEKLKSKFKKQLNPALNGK
jgi:hypothetical protein